MGESYEPQKKINEYHGPSLPKYVLADAYGMTLKELNGRIKGSDTLIINYYKKFTPGEVQLIMKLLGFNLDYSVIEKYIREIERLTK